MCVVFPACGCEQGILLLCAAVFALLMMLLGVLGHGWNSTNTATFATIMGKQQQQSIPYPYICLNTIVFVFILLLVVEDTLQGE
jgi:purine-cytosine permease-like protein